MSSSKLLEFLETVLSANIAKQQSITSLRFEFYFKNFSTCNGVQEEIELGAD
jgi:hypothetical protein